MQSMVQAVNENAGLGRAYGLLHHVHRPCLQK